MNVVLGGTSRLAMSIKEISSNFKYLSRNELEYENLKKVLKESKYIVILVGKMWGQDLSINYKIVEDVVNLIDNQKVFFASSIAVYGRRNFENYDEDTEPNPTDEYGKSKLKAEKILQESVKNYIIARIGTLYGKQYEDYIKMINFIKIWPFYFGSGQQKIPFTYVKDVANFIVNNNYSGIVNLTSPGYRLIDIIESIKEILNIKKPTIKMPTFALKLLFKDKIEPLLLSRSFNIEKALKAGFRVTDLKTSLKELIF
jgi:nucleoside-diphosphate-sugar epimerase